jgi:putative membrane protein
MRHVRILAGLAAVAAWLCMAGLAIAEDKKEGDKKEGGDKEFVTKASACGLAEVNLGNLAAVRASNPAVKEFARHMVAAHTRANQQLLGLANEKGWPAAKTMDDQHQKLFDKLSKTEGAAFDRDYMEAMVKDHEDAIKLFETESKDGKEDGLKTWAGKTLDHLKTHLKMAQDAAKQIKGGTER